MKIVLQDVGKRFGREWIFKGVDLTLLPNENYTIIGNNGSGKSTLQQVISRYVTPSRGSVTYEGFRSNKIEESHKILSIASPSTSLIQNLEVMEMIEFQASFNAFRNNISAKELLEIVRLEKSAKKQLNQLSSGMQQRLKLGLAILDDSQILLLDEPTSNLDKQGIEWYQGLLKDNCEERMVLICSNEKKEEYPTSTKEIRLETYKN